MKRHTLAALLIAGAGTAQAVTIFSDNFDANPVGLNTVPAGWSVTDGVVDIIGPGLFDLVPGNGDYVDLDGSSSNAGVLSRSFALLAGVVYTASFDLAGSQRGSAETATLSFGTTTQVVTLASAAGFAGFSLSFTPAADGSYALSFANNGGDNLGMLLDNVVIDQQVNVIPEPQTYALMGLGLLVVGFAARRRRLPR